MKTRNTKLEIEREKKRILFDVIHTQRKTKNTFIRETKIYHVFTLSRNRRKTSR